MRLRVHHITSLTKLCQFNCLKISPQVFVILLASLFLSQTASFGKNIAVGGTI